MVLVKINEVEVDVKANKPTASQKSQSDKIRNSKFREAVKDGAFLKAELKNVLRGRGQWDDDTEKRFKELGQKIEDGVKRLNEGGFEIEEAKDLAFEIGRWRNEMVQLVSIMSEMADLTAEGQADNTAFDYLVSCCAVYNTGEKAGKPVFANYEDYQNRKDEDYAFTIATEVYKTVYGGDNEDVVGSLPEYQFLKEYGFLDEKLRRIDEQGRLINQDGHLIDEDGNLINESGQRVDRYGNLVGEDGKPVLTRKPFLKNGQPIEKVEEKVESVEAEEKVDEIDKIEVENEQVG